MAAFLTSYSHFLFGFNGINDDYGCVVVARSSLKILFQFIVPPDVAYYLAN